jgi:hypothetical protein
VKHYCSKVSGGVGHVCCCKRLIASLSGFVFSFVELVASGFVFGTVDAASAAVYILNASLPALKPLSLYTLNFDRILLYDCHFDDRDESDEAHGRGGLGDSRTRNLLRTANWNDRRDTPLSSDERLIRRNGRVVLKALSDGTPEPPRACGVLSIGND